MSVEEVAKFEKATKAARGEGGENRRPLSLKVLAIGGALKGLCKEQYFPARALPRKTNGPGTGRGASPPSQRHRRRTLRAPAAPRRTP